MMKRAKAGTAWSRVAIHLTFVLLGGGPLLTGCKQGNPWAPDHVCDGQPDFCIIVGNQAEAAIAVYVDGQKALTVSRLDMAKLPLAAGETHTVRYCQERGDKCTRAETLALRGNQTRIIDSSVLTVSGPAVSSP